MFDGEKIMHEIFKNERVIVLDIEATGLSKDFDRIIELGVIEYDKGELVTEYSKLFGGGKSPISVVRVHGIKDSERRGLETFEDCAERIAKYLSNAILIGHNIKKYDVPMIKAKLATMNQQLENIQIIDTCDLAKKVKVASDNKLETLCNYFGIKHGGHRGLSDAKCTGEVLLRFIDILKIKDVNEIIQQGG